MKENNIHMEQNNGVKELFAQLPPEEKMDIIDLIISLLSER